MDMNCTYYGGSTATFVNELLRHGIVPIGTEMFHNPSYSFCLYPVGPTVAYDVSTNSISYALSLELDASVDLRGVWNKRVTKAINVEFLAGCKLLDMPTYTKALLKHPSPVALVKAIRRAKVSLVPDFPRTRKTPIELADFIEELVHFDLKPMNVTSTSVMFRMASFELGAHIGRSSSKWEIHVDCVGKASHPFGKAAIQRGDRFDTLNLDYLEGQGFIDVARFNVYAAVLSPPEALQRAARNAVGYRFTDCGSMELPSGLLSDESQIGLT
jgi:hypothetical protein